MPADHSCFYCKEAGSPHKYIMAEFSLCCTYCVYLSRDYNIKKFSDAELKKIQQVRAYLNNKLLSTKTLMDLAVTDV